MSLFGVTPSMVYAAILLPPPCFIHCKSQHVSGRYLAYADLSNLALIHFMHDASVVCVGSVKSASRRDCLAAIDTSLHDKQNA
jgi:hypothetical protein